MEAGLTSFWVMLFQILQILLDVIWVIIIVQFILSILIAFNVINTYNGFVAGLYEGLNRLTEPLYRPIRRILPDTHPLDLAPLAVLILIQILERAVLPWLFELVTGVA